MSVLYRVLDLMQRVSELEAEIKKLQDSMAQPRIMISVDPASNTQLTLPFLDPENEKGPEAEASEPCLDCLAVKRKFGLTYCCGNCA